MTGCSERGVTQTDGPLTANVLALRQRVREEHSWVYRNAILDAAEQLLAERGVHGHKVADTAKMAGVSVGTVYNYFRDKEAILAALLERQRFRLLERLGQPYRSDDCVSQLEEFIGRTLLWREQTAFAYDEMLAAPTNGAKHEGLVVNGLSKETDGGYSQLLRQCICRCARENRIRSDHSVEEVVWYIEALMRMVILGWIESERQQALSEKGKLIVRLLFEGVAVAGGAGRTGQ